MRKILLSVNENLVDKHVGGPKRYFREGFESRELSVRALADSINQGFAFSVQYDGGTASPAGMLGSVPRPSNTG